MLHSSATVNLFTFKGLTYIATPPGFGASNAPFSNTPVLTVQTGSEGPKYELPGHYSFDLYVFRRKTLVWSAVGNRAAFARLRRLPAGVERGDHHAGPLLWSTQTGCGSEGCLGACGKIFAIILLRAQRTSDLRPCLFLAAVEECGERIPP